MPRRGRPASPSLLPTKAGDGRRVLGVTNTRSYWNVSPSVLPVSAISRSMAWERSQLPNFAVRYVLRSRPHFGRSGLSSKGRQTMFGGSLSSSRFSASPNRRRLAINRFIAWYCSEPRLTFNRAVVVRYRSHLEGLRLSASTINLHLSAIRRLADESSESGWLTPELAIGIRRVPGVKRLSRPTANAGGTMGHPRFDRQGKTAANSSGSVMVQAASGCMARAFGREPREGVQKGFEEGETTGSWRDGQRGLVCGQAVCATGWHRESGATRSSSYLCPTLPRLQRRT
jgi:hypothetical protein